MNASVFQDNIVFSLWRRPGRIADPVKPDALFSLSLSFFFIFWALVQAVAGDCYIFQTIFRNDRSLTRMQNNEATLIILTLYRTTTTTTKKNNLKMSDEEFDS